MPRLRTISPRSLLAALAAAVALALGGCAEITGPDPAHCLPSRQFADARCADPLVPLIPLTQSR